MRVNYCSSVFRTTQKWLLLNVLYLIDHMHNEWRSRGVWMRCPRLSLAFFVCVCVCVVLDHALGQMGIRANTKYQSESGNPTTIGNWCPTASANANPSKNPSRTQQDETSTWITLNVFAACGMLKFYLCMSVAKLAAPTLWAHQKQHARDIKE